MLSAHIDELGYWIKSISPEGFLHATKIGVPDKAVEARQVIVNGRIPGIVGTMAAHLQSPEDRRKLMDPRDLFIDIGASSKAEAEALGVRIGSYASPVYNYMEMSNSDKICCRALDNRAGCAVLLELLANVDKSKLKYELWLAFTLQEEVGLRGAAAAVNWLVPDMMIAVDTVPCADTPGINWKKDLPAYLGGGVVCSISEGMGPMNFIHPVWRKRSCACAKSTIYLSSPFRCAVTAHPPTPWGALPRPEGLPEPHWQYPGGIPIPPPS